MKRWRLLFLTLLITLCFNSYTFASYLSNFEERPIAFEPGKSMGYFLWQDKEGMHLRITSTGVTHIFSGTIRTDGRFEDIRYKGDNEQKSSDVSRSQNKITYNFITSEEEKGIDFQLSYGSYVKFDLSLDGESINSEEIFIGKDGWHPTRNRFTLRQDEDYRKYSDGHIVYIIDGGFWRSGWHGGHGPRPGHPEHH
ncbi:MAG: hypothetical protein K0R78_216 [Pelosinus sp.]|nr:hypothetical protein [Pelosinus sp.]